MRQLLAEARRRLASYQARSGGELTFANELTEKRRQLAGIDKALAADIEGLNDAGAKAG